MLASQGSVSYAFNDLESSSNLNISSILHDTSMDELQRMQLIKKIKNKQTLLNKIKNLDEEMNEFSTSKQKHDES